MTSDQSLEIDRNLIAFQSVVANYLSQHRGSYAVLRNQEVVDIHARLSDAIEGAHLKFEDGLFSIQEITDRPIDLGFFSHANPHR
jgi:hypothetical protein